MSDGQFSAKPMRSDRIREGFRDAGEYSAEARISTDDARAFLDSPAVQREVDALSEHSFPETGKSDCKPLHKRTPDAAKELGPPMASATLVQEHLFGLLFLRFFGWVFMFFGGMFLLMAVGFLIARLVNGPDPRDRDGFAAFIPITGIGLAIGAAGAWFGIFRGRVITEMCWFCPRGMIWMTNGFFEWYRWEQVPDVYCQPQAVRPAIGISLGLNVSWISFKGTPASRVLVERIEKQASARCLRNVLEQFADGKTIRFGTWRVSRFSIRDGNDSISWNDVAAVACDHREFWIKHEGGSVTASLDEIPFPSLFAALALAAYGYMREQTL